MRIKPGIVTGTAAIVALAAVTVVVEFTTPHEAGAWLLRLLWAALFLGVWSALATGMLLLRQTVAQAIWTALIVTLGALSALVLFRHGMHAWRLLGSVLLATLVVGTLVWWCLRHLHARPT